MDFGSPANVVAYTTDSAPTFEIAHSADGMSWVSFTPPSAPPSPTPPPSPVQPVAGTFEFTAQYARVSWQSTSWCLAQGYSTAEAISEGCNDEYNACTGIHFQFRDAAGALITPAAITVAGATGWNQPASQLLFGGCGLSAEAGGTEGGTPPRAGAASPGSPEKPKKRKSKGKDGEDTSRDTSPPPARQNTAGTAALESVEVHPVPAVVRRTVLLRALREQWLQYKENSARYEALAAEALAEHRERARIQAIKDAAKNLLSPEARRAAAPPRQFGRRYSIRQQMSLRATAAEMAAVELTPRELAALGPRPFFGLLLPEALLINVIDEAIQLSRFTGNTVFRRQ